jgi:hypothetical protein
MKGFTFTRASFVIPLLGFGTGSLWFNALALAIFLNPDLVGQMARLRQALALAVKHVEVFARWALFVRSTVLSEVVVRGSC